MIGSLGDEFGRLLPRRLVLLGVSLILFVLVGCSGGGTSVSGGTLLPTSTPSALQEFCSLVTLVDSDDASVDRVAEHRALVEIRPFIPSDVPPGVVEYLDGIHRMGELTMAGESTPVELMVALATYDKTELEDYIDTKCP